MSQRSSALLVPAVLLVAVAANAGSSSAGNECQVKPGGAAPQGTHWYYWRDPATNRQCWFLGRENARVRRHAINAAATPSKAAAQPLEEPTESPVAPPPASPDEPIATPAAEPDVNQSAVMLRWPDLSAPSSFATPIRPVTNVWQSSEPSLVASSSVSRGEASSAPPPEVSVQAPATRPAPVNDANRVFALIMTALALLMIAGPVSHVGNRHHRRASKERRAAAWARTLFTLRSRERTGAPLVPCDSTGVPDEEASASPERLDWSEQFARAWQQLSEDSETGRAPRVMAQSA